MGKQGEDAFAWEYNKICGRIFAQERKERNISQEDLAAGIVGRSTLGDMESGRNRWTKLAGDILLQRMGIDPNYFETVATAEELERWRFREDICLLIPMRQAEAKAKIQGYREKYEEREALEEQFLEKTEVLLMLLERQEHAGTASMQDREILSLALDAVACTVSGNWKTDLDSLWLAPAELEAILLAGAALAACGRSDEAWELQQTVWKYPEKHQWGERVMMLIKPQAAMLGMGLALERDDMPAAYALGREALELLRRHFCHCYALPLLECLGKISVQEISLYGEEGVQYLERAKGFAGTFRQMYRQYGYPEYRLWQGVSMDNTREVGVMMEMLRHFEGLSRREAVCDGEADIVTERHLIKIEKGEHKPSEETYRHLLQRYGKNVGWETAMLETETVRQLELRQKISTMLGLRQWKEAEREIEKLRRSTNPDAPRVKQEMLFWKALYKWKEKDYEGCLNLALDALHCTAPAFEGKDMKWWVFQREEIMIVSKIAGSYRMLGRTEEAKKWYEAVIFSLKKQINRSGIAYNGYDILMVSCGNLLGDIKHYEDAVKINEETIVNCLRWPQIRYVADIFYQIAWNTYEMAKGKEDKEKQEEYHQRWRNAFQVSDSLGLFIYDADLKAFLNDRRQKYLS